jgi:hypothetical protein
VYTPACYASIRRDMRDRRGAGAGYAIPVVAEEPLAHLRIFLRLCALAFDRQYGPPGHFFLFSAPSPIVVLEYR